MSTISYNHSSPSAVMPSNYGICDPRAGSISLCCGVGHTCLTNGLCVTRSGIYYSGGCTDSTYEAAICPQFCTSGGHPAIDMATSILTWVIGDANWVVECPSGTAVEAGDFCCSVNGTAKTCCDTASNGLGLGAAVFSAQALSAVSVETSSVPACHRSGATNTSSRNITSWNPFFRAGQRLACMLIICRFFYGYMDSRLRTYPLKGSSG